jgi:hypothetical protein
VKYAGTVITASFISFPKKSEAVYFIFNNTIDEISSGENLFVSPLNLTSIIGLSSPSEITLNGKCFKSS